MPSWRSVRPGRQYVNLTNLGAVVIKDVLSEVLESQYQGKPQLVGLLQKSDLNVSLNTTSCKALSKAYGDDYLGWVGKKVKVSKGSVKFGAGSVPAILVEPDGK